MGEDPEGHDWMGGLETVGVGKCHMCGERLPLDIDSMERHDRECWQRSLDPTVPDLSAQASCRDCRASLPMDINAIEDHSRCCPARPLAAEAMRSGRRSRPLVAWFGGLRHRPR